MVELVAVPSLFIHTDKHCRNNETGVPAGLSSGTVIMRVLLKIPNYYCKHKYLYIDLGTIIELWSMQSPRTREVE